MIRVEKVTFGYQKRKEILKDINLEINDKETVVIMGKNGSGKSTLGKLISGILKTKKGKIFIDDLDIVDKNNKEEIRKKIGIVFQNPENQIIFNQVEDEMSFALKGLEQENVQERIESSLRKVAMEDKRKEDLYQLSLGQKQRIVIGEVLAKQPKYIIFDEPTTMIDSQGKEKIYHIIEELKKEGYTILYITNMAEEMLLADRIVLLHEGQIVEQIKKEELVSKLDVFAQYDIKIPIILEIIQKFKQEGIELMLTNYTVNELVTKLKEVIKK